jgi:hypothetical protein
VKEVLEDVARQNEAEAFVAEQAAGWCIPISSSLISLIGTGGAIGLVLWYALRLATLRRPALHAASPTARRYADSR